MTELLPELDEVPLQDILQRADGIQFIGQMRGSGYRVPPSLIRRADGQTIQLSPLLLAILQEIDGRRSSEQIAAAVSESTGRSVSAGNVEMLVEAQLRPLGLLVCADGSQPLVRKRNPLLGIRFRYAITDPERTRRITGPFQFLFRMWAVLPLLAAFTGVCWWVFVRKGLAAATWDAFERPGLLILVFVITILSAGFHEFGHAAAARYGGATPGVMGFGVYLVWPAFYTDVTDSYRLGRWGRLRVDLGGLYFNALVAVAITGAWWVLRYDALLLIVATQILQMLRQLAPMVRFDGYHVVADITGVPDLYSRMKPTLLGALPWRWGDPEANLLKVWARVVVTAWVLIVVPLLASLMLGAVLAFPRLLGTAWLHLGKQRRVLSAAWVDGDMIQALARVLAMVAIVIPVAGVIYMMVRIIRRTAITGWRSTAGKPLARTLATVCGAVALSGLAWAWWPRESAYIPIQPTEHGAFFNIELTPVVHAMRSTAGVELTREARSTGPAPAASHTGSPLSTGSRGVMPALWDNNSPRPTRQSPQLAVILVPRQPTLPAGLVGNGGGGATAAAAVPADQGWVFPVEKPMTPGPGDNQALAVNTRDGTVVYDTAFALVWVTDNSYAQNINDGEAYASCRDCAAVAVAYQVVFVIDSNAANDNVATPESLAGALNYNCVNCMTYGLAGQVFVTLKKPLSVTAMAQLALVWAEVSTYGIAIKAGLVPVNQIDHQLGTYTDRILTIVEHDQPGTIPAAMLPSSTATATSSAAAPAPADSRNLAPPQTDSQTSSTTASTTPSTTPSTTGSATASATAPQTATSSAQPTTSAAAPSTQPSGTETPDLTDTAASMPPELTTTDPASTNPATDSSTAVPEPIIDPSTTSGSSIGTESTSAPTGSSGADTSGSGAGTGDASTGTSSGATP